jgi:hypothetical protein
MTEVAPKPIGEILGGMATDDGSHVLIQTRQTSGDKTVIAIRAEQLVPLIDMLASAYMRCRQINNVPLSQRYAYRTTWWELSFTPATGLTILSLTFGSGGRLDFTLPGPMPAQILETLRNFLEPPTNQKLNRPLN